MKAASLTKNYIEKWLKLHFPPSGAEQSHPRVYFVHICGARETLGGLLCTCSMDNDDVGWHIACRERSYRTE